MDISNGVRFKDTQETGMKKIICKLIFFILSKIAVQLTRNTNMSKSSEGSCHKRELWARKSYFPWKAEKTDYLMNFP